MQALSAGGQALSAGGQALSAGGQALSAGGQAPSAGGRGETAFLALLGAVLFAAAYPVPGLWPLSFVAIAPLVILAVRARSTRGALLAVFVTQFGAFLWLERWIAGVTLAGYPVLAAVLAIYPSAFFLLVRRAARLRSIGRLPLALIAAITWTGLEWVRGDLAFDGYCWFLLAHPLVEWPLLVQSADLFGTYFVSFLAALAGGALAEMLLARAMPARRTRALAGALGALGLWALALAWGAYRLAHAPSGEPIQAILIQTNLPQSNKIAWSFEDQVRDFASFVDLTRRAIAEAGGAPSVVVWPETMLPGMGLDAATLSALERYEQRNALAFAESAYALAAEIGIPFLVGGTAYVDLAAVDGKWVWSAQYNSAYLIGPDGSLDRYDKVMLTPFGEVMPYISAWPWLEERLLSLGAPGMSFALASSPTIERLEVGGRNAPLVLATPICFEDTVPRVCRRMVWSGGDKVVDLFVNLSNDGWFGTVDAVRDQHVQIARFRAIENRVPLVRCANTGRSVVIDSSGRQTDSLEPRREGWLLASVTPDSRRTLYGRLGDAWGWTCAIVAALIALPRRAVKVRA